MNLVKWLRSLRGNESASAMTIRRELQSLRGQRSITVHQRDLLALDAVNDDPSASRWLHLDATVIALDRRIAVLEAALPQAEAREAKAAAQAEALARSTFQLEYERKTAEIQAWLDGQLAQLPDGETLTKARDLRDSLSGDAGQMRAWSNALNVRRPLDPLHVLTQEMQRRIDCISRSRWTRRQPITLDDKRAAS